jgi:hypothetical protein
MIAIPIPTRTVPTAAGRRFSNKLKPGLPNKLASIRAPNKSEIMPTAIPTPVKSLFLEMFAFISRKNAHFKFKKLLINSAFSPSS